MSLTEFLKRHPCVSPLLFPTESDVAVPTSVVLDKLTVDVDEPQPLEPNKLRAYGFLQDYIKDCEEKNTGKGYTILLLAVGWCIFGCFLAHCLCMNILTAVGSGVVQECFYCTNMLAGNLFSKSLPPPL